METTTEQVKEYYGKILKTNQDLKTNACCLSESIPAYQREILSQIPAEVLEKFYGCGSPIPLALKGKIILDLGCGSGRDVFLLSALAGSQSRLIGIDMTDEQLAVAKRALPAHLDRFRFPKEAVEFKKGFIENLRDVGIEDNSIDIIVSNCVINLSPDKASVFREIFRVLKPGGELYFSDVFASRRLPETLSQDPVLLGECLGGALYFEDFRRLLLNLGIRDYRIVSSSKIKVSDPTTEAKLGATEFYSNTIRAFKLDLEDRCEDYGQAAIYKGGIPHSEEIFILDDHHTFERNRPMLVCSNTADMLSKSRYGEYFSILGDQSKHFGLFDCLPSSVLKSSENTSPGGCC
ncbi:MAG: methyltransferase domain-containing protein [Bacteriovoracia bacterium]